MKLKNQIVLAEPGEDYTAVPVGGGKENYMIRLNAAGANIWRDIEAGPSLRQLCGSSRRTEP